MPLRQWGFSAAVLTLLAMGQPANACSVAPFNETWANFGTATWVGTDADCRLEAAVPASAQANSAAAVVHYRRSPDTGPIRLSFRIQAPPVGGINAMSVATLARGTAKRSPSEGPSQAHLFSVSIFGNAPGTQLVLGLSAACSSCAGGARFATAPIPLTDFPFRVTVELTVGAGAAGQLKYWIGADDTSLAPTRPPLGDLDNARWERVERVSIGVSDTTPLWRTILAGNPLTLDQIGVSQTSLFWSDFDSDDADNVAVTIPTPLSSNVIYQGNTCAGSTVLPQLAAGSSSFRGPVTIQPLNIAPDSSGRTITLSTSSGMAMAAYVCRAGGGPASQCFHSGEPGAPMVIPFGFTGSYWVVVGAMGRVKDGACGTYLLNAAGPL